MNRDRVAWLIVGLVLAGTIAYAGKRFMEPNDPRGEAFAPGPPPGSEWVGKRFEPFHLRGVDGKPVDSSRDLGRQPVVVVFHGGRESPFSMIQVAHLGAAKEIRAAKAVVYTISIEDPKETSREVHDEWRRQKLPENRPDFVFVGDDFGDFSRPYVGAPTTTTPRLPASLNRATFVMGKGGKILFAYVNATPKLHPPEDAMLAAVVKAGREFEGDGKQQ
jgi:peroxiredoxin